MEERKFITFNKDAQNKIPKEVRDKMQKDRKQAQEKQLGIQNVVRCYCKKPRPNGQHGATF